MWQKILRFLMKIVWPEIKKLLRKMVREILTWFVKNLIKMITDYFKKQREYATQKAADAEKQCKQTQDQHEEDKLRAIAQVWREVAENFRRENEDLSDEINRLKDTLESQVDEKIDLMEFSETFSEDDNHRPILRPKDTYLALPSSNGNRDNSCS